MRSLPLLALAGILVLAPRSMAAEKPPNDEAIGIAAARYDAFLNLSRTVYALPSNVKRTIGGSVASDEKLRDGVEAALRGAEIVDGPHIDANGLVRISVELDTSTLPYALRARAPRLPGTVRADGLAHKAAAFKAFRMAVGEQTDEVKEWIETALEAEGEADVPRSAKPDAKQRARRQAIINACSALAEQVNKLRLDADVTIAAFLTQHPDLREKVNAALTGTTLVSESLDRRGTTYKVKISFPARALARPLRLGEHRTTRGKHLDENEIELARRNAVRDAGETLKKRIHGLRLRSGATAADFMKNRDDMKKGIDRLCRRRPIDKVEITDDGVVKVYVSLSTRALPSELRRLLATDPGPRLHVIGGGLPLEPREPRPAEKPAEKSAPKSKGAAE